MSAVNNSRIIPAILLCHWIKLPLFCKAFGKEEPYFMYEATIDNTLLFQTTTGRGDLRSQFLSADGNTLIADSEIYGPIFYFPVYFS